jgi:hypothetical protein
MMAEMRGDMPSNFFAWILRYPEQDDVVIVLRNGYGSTENLEQNLQAILFDREPRLPKRSPGDLAAHVGWISLDWTVGHRVLFATVVVLLVLFLFRTARKRKSSVYEIQADRKGPDSSLDVESLCLPCLIKVQEN